MLRVEPTPDHRHVAIVRGGQHRGQTAGLKIEGDLRQRGGAPIEQGEFTLDYLPADPSREGGLFFTREPRVTDLELRLRLSGYRQP